MSITKVHARQVRSRSLASLRRELGSDKTRPSHPQIFDSRGNPTVEVDVHTAKGEMAILNPASDHHSHRADC